MTVRPPQQEEEELQQQEEEEVVVEEVGPSLGPLETNQPSMEVVEVLPTVSITRETTREEAVLISSRYRASIRVAVGAYASFSVHVPMRANK